MRGQVCWERNIECGGGIINVHITKQDSRKLLGVEAPIFFIIPSRIGIDFYNFRHNGSIDYIPNASVSDIVQIIDRLHVLSSEIVREAILKGVFKHKFGIELDFRRRLDLNLAINANKKEIVEMYYEDPRRFGRFLIGAIEVSSLVLIQRALKECIVEYTYLTNKLLIK
jgi:hypothetical protein